MARAGKNDFPYVAFLRGVNVGGHAAIKMADLKAVFEKMGFGGVKTVLASGNVIFEARSADEKGLRVQIESGLKKAFKREIHVLLRNRHDLIRLRSAGPFKQIDASPRVQLYVTFLPDGARTPAIEIPYAAPRNGLRILGATATEVFSVVDLGQGMGTPEAMAILEKEFGPGLTTRNWNTVLNVLS